MTDIARIWQQQVPSDKYLVVKTRIKELAHINCYAATNHKTGNHSFVMEIGKEVKVPDRKKLSFHGVRVQLFELDGHNELHILLMDLDLNGVFSKFINNILEDITPLPTQNEIILTTFNVIEKWKKLFHKLSTDGLTIEQQKGLIGELLVISEHIDSNINVAEIVNGWLGPEGQDKDFLISNSAIEAKFTISNQPRVRITNEHQLDSKNLSNLFLWQFHGEKANQGISLNSIVESIRLELQSSISTLDAFERKLNQAGYFEKHMDNYQTVYSIKKWSLYHVRNEFPKIDSQTIPAGIYNTSYFIEQSAILEYEINKQELQSLIKNG